MKQNSFQKEHSNKQLVQGGRFFTDVLRPWSTPGTNRFFILPLGLGFSTFLPIIICICFRCFFLYERVEPVNTHMRLLSMLHTFPYPSVGDLPVLPGLSWLSLRHLIFFFLIKFSFFDLYKKKKEKKKKKDFRMPIGEWVSKKKSFKVEKILKEKERITFFPCEFGRLRRKCL